MGAGAASALNLASWNETLFDFGAHDGCALTISGTAGFWRLSPLRRLRGSSKRMCGIIGIIGQWRRCSSSITLKRLEYRGYDSAGVATLEHGALTRRRAEGKLRNLEQKLAREPLSGTIGHRPYALGDAWPPDREQRASACNRDSLPCAITVDHREFQRKLRRELEKRKGVPSFRPRPIPKSLRTSSPEEMKRGGLDPVDAVKAALPRLRKAPLRSPFVRRREENLLIASAKRRAARDRLGDGADAASGSDAIALRRSHRAWSAYLGKTATGSS